MALEEAALVEAHREASEEAVEEAPSSVAAIWEEIVATTTTPGAEDGSDVGLPIAQCALWTVIYPCSKKCPVATTGQYQIAL